MSTEPVVISHSEVETFLSCQQKHYYAFGDSTYGEHVGLEPMHLGDGLFRGLTGHEALSIFFTHIQQGLSINEASEAALNSVRVMGTRPEIFTQPRKLEIVTDLAGRILPRYFKNDVVQQLDQGWFPVYVEQTFRLQMDFEEGSFIYPFKPDVVMRDSVGNLWVWDHKFVYNYYTMDEIQLLPQIPKYIGALRALGHHVKGGYYNMLRWREVKSDPTHVQSVEFKPSDARVQNAFRQQYNVMVEIARRKLQDRAKWEAENTRVLSTMVCKSCSFKMVCTADLNGLNTDLMRRVEYKPNSYGYTATEEG